MFFLMTWDKCPQVVLNCGHCAYVVVWPSPWPWHKHEGIKKNWIPCSMYPIHASEVCSPASTWRTHEWHENISLIQFNETFHFLLNLMAQILTIQWVMSECLWDSEKCIHHFTAFFFLITIIVHGERTFFDQCALHDLQFQLWPLP